MAYDFDNLCRMFITVLKNILVSCQEKNYNRITDICDCSIKSIKRLQGEEVMIKITCKNQKTLKSILVEGWHPTLINIYLWIINKYPDAIITEGYRLRDMGVHGTKPLRAFDLRAWSFKAPEKVAEDINKNWSYDHIRPHLQVCVFHAVCPICKTNHNITNEGMVKTCVKCSADISGHWHFHIQCSEYTKQIKEGVL